MKDKKNLRTGNPRRFGKLQAAIILIELRTKDSHEEEWKEN